MTPQEEVEFDGILFVSYSDAEYADLSRRADETIDAYEMGI